MRMHSATWIAFGAAAVFGFWMGCIVTPPDGKYACASDQDCGGGGYVCTPAGAGPRFCCKPSGAEVCDGQDNDCNGAIDDVAPDSCYTGTQNTAGVGLCHAGTAACADGGSICVGQVVPVTEICNQADDDCNGRIDETFNLKVDPLNCGRCGVGCSAPLRCEDGGCAIPIETNCGDGLDNDGDRATDCADSDCATLACGTGCVCRNFQKVETVCSDGQDNDSDTQADCADNDCDGGSCGTGCVCNRGGKLETVCDDGQDNDTDTQFDCSDTDCNLLSCDAGCQCRGGQGAETVCSDMKDNDGDSFTDCLDSDCDGGMCGTGCLCRGGQKTETICNDIADNDGDSQADCADSDCDGGSCGTGCVCSGGQKTETNCLNTSGDEDGDGNANCNDPDCLGKQCRTSPSRNCTAIGVCG
ncbi:MAG TPA: MopE-related protein [Myxococcales bacterium]|nr:MopE-related protein [Myxococcales bacterium]